MAETAGPAHQPAEPARVPSALAEVSTAGPSTDAFTTRLLSPAAFLQLQHKAGNASVASRRAEVQRSIVVQRDDEPEWQMVKARSDALRTTTKAIGDQTFILVGLAQRNAGAVTNPDIKKLDDDGRALSDEWIATSGDIASRSGAWSDAEASVAGMEADVTTLNQRLVPYQPLIAAYKQGVEQQLKVIGGKLAPLEDEMSEVKGQLRKAADELSADLLGLENAKDKEAANQALDALSMIFAFEPTGLAAIPVTLISLSINGAPNAVGVTNIVATGVGLATMLPGLGKVAQAANVISRVASLTGIATSAVGGAQQTADDQKAVSAAAAKVQQDFATIVSLSGHLRELAAEATSQLNQAKAIAAQTMSGTIQ